MTDFSDSSIWKKAPYWRTAPLDALILVVLLVSVNWFLFRADPGWQRLNPTPWLLVPLFLGGRYGVGAGVLGAILATGCVLGLQFAAENLPPLDSLRANPFYFLALLLVGAIGAVIHHLVKGPAERLRQRALSLAEQNRRLEEESAVYRANEVQLVDSLLLHGAESITLTESFQHLFTGNRDDFYGELLSVLKREFGVVSAAIYRNEKGNWDELARTAVTTTGESSFPDQVPSGDETLASAAIKMKKMATWNSASPDQSYLAAMPWAWSPLAGRGPAALLLIGRMDFARIDWESLSRLEAIFAWCMARFEPQQKPSEESVKILSADVFKSRIDEATALESRMGLPSFLIHFSAESTTPQEVFEDLAERLNQIAPPTDSLGVVSDGTTSPYSLGLLTASKSPATAEKSAHHMLAQLGDEFPGIQWKVVPLEQDSNSAPTSHAVVETVTN